jgi:CheY-like chemotaxis protein/HPt (histidine-containing phosphotransfer) domain-containing protein
MEAGRLVLVEADFDVEHVVASVVALMRPRARDKGLALETTLADDVPRAVRGDGGRLRQVLLNLVANALTFTEIGSVRLQIAGVGGSADRPRLRVAVTDTGPGIAPEAQGRLFQEFSQVDAAGARRPGGTGLGLAICKRIVEAMGGQIGVESAPGRGSTFWFVVTLDRAHGTVAAQGPARPAASGSLRILVAEDNRVNQEVARGLLERLGHRVDVVDDGHAAVEAVQRGNYDVVLMDVHMPGLDGLGAARAIRRLPTAAARTPIIALSASALPDEARACLSAGMDGYLAKPVDPSALAQALAGRARPTDVAEATAAAPVQDEAYLRALVEALGPAKLLEIVARGADDVRSQHQRARRAWATGDLGEVRAAAHALRGIATNLGLTALAALSGGIEEASVAGAGEPLEVRYRQLEACVATALDRLRAFPGAGPV